MIRPISLALLLLFAHSAQAEFVPITRAISAKTSTISAKNPAAKKSQDSIFERQCKPEFRSRVIAVREEDGRKLIFVQREVGDTVKVYGPRADDVPASVVPGYRICEEPEKKSSEQVRTEKNEFEASCPASKRLRVLSRRNERDRVVLTVKEERGKESFTYNLDPNEVGINVVPGYRVCETTPDWDN